MNESRKPIVWTPQMLKIMRDFYPTMFNAALSAWIGVSKRSLERKAKELGICKVDGFHEKRKADIERLASEGLKKAYREGRIKGVFRKGVRNNPDGEFRPGRKESPEIKAKRVASMREYYRRKRQMEVLGLKY